MADLDSDGELVFRDCTERLVPDPDTRRVLAPITDPVPPAAAGRVPPQPAADRVAD